MAEMDDIKQKVHRRVHSKVVQERRDEFNRHKEPLAFHDIEYRGLTKITSRLRWV